ncbi:AAA family ATPase [Candidatus Kaiserbacteria bacterium]|nr:AAA family ATPase [Candidatus Kaiserbacteria bacterium]
MIQTDALSILKTGANVFLTGEPGAGKTYVLNQYIDWLEACDVPVAVTASTGIAATHIGGMTIHAWSGIGARDTLSPYDLDTILTKEKVVKRVKNAKVLVIDEISMLDGRVLDMVDTVCRAIRGREEAFGGLQTILVGDFFQLPPVAGRGEVARFAFESRAWDSARFLTCYLTEQHRQEDELLLGLLAAIRKNDVDEEHYTLLSEQQSIDYEHIEPTRLFTHNKNVDEENAARLSDLAGGTAVFKMDGKGNRTLVDGLIKSCLSPQVLTLKQEALVMCTKNNFEAGYVNGTLGRVLSFDPYDGYPVIETSDGREIKVMPASWTVGEDGKVLAEITQVPLRLAWAITVHKSQGMSLDAAEIDLRNAFTYGQGYVALSRVRSLAGMKVLGLNSNALTVDPKIVLRDARFREESDEAERVFGEMDTAELTRMQQNFVKACGGAWSDGARAERAPGADRFVRRLRKESTHAISKDLLKKGLSIPAIAKERNMTQSTIWSHIEKLLDDKELVREDLAGLIAHEREWDTTYDILKDAFNKCGAERLKPVYEELGERYGYDSIRLGRLMYLIGE